MKKEISFSTHGQRADIGKIKIYRLLPNRYAQAIGPFVFLDHIGPQEHAPDEPREEKGTGAHPHRGIATLTYLLHGEATHFDSAGHQATVQSGGIQWMKAGNGIIHDENLNPDPQETNQLTHALQFWINLPGTIKAEKPQYLAIQTAEVPQKTLDNNQGWVKVIVGQYENISSPIPNYSGQFIYHLHLAAGQTFSLATEAGWEYAALLPKNAAIINGQSFKAGEFVEFGREGDLIEVSNQATAATDIIFFGGEPYLEPIVAEGPFVMNSQLEIAQAYRDFFNGQYGTIAYN